jgi:ParB family transcriptional regulator, chromosome partitioning protein
MAEDTVRYSEHRPRLGRGLAALLGDNNKESTTDPAGGVRKAAIELLRPNPRNPRKSFAAENLEELAESIRSKGIIQPIVVRNVPHIADAYEIVAGERRWRAAQRVGLHEIPILVIAATDLEALEIALVENVQRADLNALEEANGYAQLSADHGYTHSDIARVVGKSRSHVANTLRLANLPEHSRKLLASGEISAGHARALLAVTDPDSLADCVVAKGLTVRDVERLGENTGRSSRPSAKTGRTGDPDTRALEKKLSLTLGAKVLIRHSGDEGEIRIGFRSFEQLDDFCHRLAKPIPR